MNLAFLKDNAVIIIIALITLASIVGGIIVYLDKMVESAKDDRELAVKSKITSDYAVEELNTTVKIISTINKVNKVDMKTVVSTLKEKEKVSEEFNDIKDKAEKDYLERRTSILSSTNAIAVNSTAAKNSSVNVDTRKTKIVTKVTMEAIYNAYNLAVENIEGE